MYRCPECGREYAEVVRVCAGCGAPFEGVGIQTNTFCAECGSAIPAGDTTCKNCGAPVMTAGADAGPLAKQNGKTVITIGNIIFLVTLIPATILLLGDMFVFKASRVLEESFSYFGFSKTFNYLTDLLDIMEGFGVDSLDTVRTMTGVLGFTWTVVVIALINVAIEFVKGFLQANKGKVLDKLCFMPLTYLAMSFLFNLIVHVVLLSPINDVLEDGIVGAINEFVGFKLSIDMGAPAAWLACIGLVNVVVYIVTKLVEKLSTRAQR